jgi:hypothetical protein
MFDPTGLEWTDIGSAAAASLPPARQSFGFAGAAGALFVFGGMGANAGEEVCRQTAQ